MSPTLHHESTRVPVTALASCGALLIAAEGPFLRFYHAKTSRYIASKRVFKAQAVHGICVTSERVENVTNLVVWGGRLVRALQINAVPDASKPEPLSPSLSNVVRAPDWILDLAPQMGGLHDDNMYSQGICAAVTAHNALLKLTMHCPNETAHSPSNSSLSLEICELTTSSRSILYSAHLLWESPDRILVAAGTAFGEIMYWSWTKVAHAKADSSIHQVFLGHEGSIFDVRISKELPGCCGNLTRVIASCSDDRTIRLWDVSDVNVDIAETDAVSETTEVQRTRHTGFSVAATDTQSDNSHCLAIGWGHTSRVWKVRFLDSPSGDGSLGLLSAGEDATSRTWKLAASTGKADALPCTLEQTDCAAYHNGRNMWSITTYREAAGSVRVACGAADSKLTTHPLIGADRHTQGQHITSSEYSVQELLHMAQPSGIVEETHQLKKVSKKEDSIRSYCFVLNSTFLLITNSGKILVKSFGTEKSPTLPSNLATSVMVDQLEELSGYSTCIGAPTHGVAFLAGTRGSIYMYSAVDKTLQIIHTIAGKVGALFVTGETSIDGRNQLVLLITLMGQRQAQLLYIDLATSSSPLKLRVLSTPISDISTGPTITSMLVVRMNSEQDFLFLGFRRGSISLNTLSHDTTSPEATLLRILEKVHGDDTVTAMMFQVSRERSSAGYLYSVGRDGCLAVHWIDLTGNITKLVHKLVLPIGPNIEDLYFHQNHLLVHGFSSKKWILYDVSTEEEIMGIETGGAHRSWAFQPNSDPSCLQGGVLVWTRTSSLHICSQQRPNHDVLRSGGHGRELKAVAVSLPIRCLQGPEKRLVATGAEDTDIRIFQYIGGELVCRTTLRKHTTGIQHLQWSDDGEYLFSSAGSEEFYIWRVRALETVVDIGVVCEYVYTPESEFSDLRIMSFDVARSGNAFTIAMVFSDSSIKTYLYDPTLATKWQSLSKGIYFTSCLTQCIFVSPTTLLTAGTDGHAVFWPLPVNASGQALTWQDPARIHQNASKAMASHTNSLGTMLIVSGGDDGALTFLLVHPTKLDHSRAAQGCYTSPPVLVKSAHSSAVTAVAVVNVGLQVYVLTSGNDEWIRLWEIVIGDADDGDASKGSPNGLIVKRISKVKTSVADVSSMAVVDDYGDASRVLICGVGMEIIRLER